MKTEVQAKQKKRGRDYYNVFWKKNTPQKEEKKKGPDTASLFQRPSFFNEDLSKMVLPRLGLGTPHYTEVERK